jgi:hypothetical protein
MRNQDRLEAYPTILLATISAASKEHAVVELVEFHEIVACCERITLSGEKRNFKAHASGC